MFVFQFTPLREGRLDAFAENEDTEPNFNSRPSARGDSVPRPAQSGGAISIHAPPRGATRGQVRRAGQVQFQFTPLREGRRRFARQRGQALHISIHAPPRGATSQHFENDAFCNISIHAPPRGATTCAACTSCAAAFQFTPLREGRPDSHATAEHQRCKFQFTPLREGRPILSTIWGNAAHFNSRPSARGDPRILQKPLKRYQFQFTPLREGRLDVRSFAVRGKISIHAPPRGATPMVKASVSPAGFQFTPLREGRRCACGVVRGMTIFQFTPLREGRQRVLDVPRCAYEISIHAPPRGATASFLRRLLWRDISIHAPPRGATFAIPNGGYRAKAFQFTPLREGRPRGRTSATASAYFNSRPSARGDRTP